jgi:hypothetical protein
MVKWNEAIISTDDCMYLDYDNSGFSTIDITTCIPDTYYYTTNCYGTLLVAKKLLL